MNPKAAPTHIKQTTKRVVHELLSRALAYRVGGGEALEDLTDGCALFSMTDEAGNLAGAFALECITDRSGTVMNVTAAGGRPGFDLVGDMVAFTANEAKTRVMARALRLTTKRRGLVKRLQREGFYVAGFILQKDITS